MLKLATDTRAESKALHQNRVQIARAARAPPLDASAASASHSDPKFYDDLAAGHSKNLCERKLKSRQRAAEGRWSSQPARQAKHLQEEQLQMVMFMLMIVMFYKQPSISFLILIQLKIILLLILQYKI